jgi:hypothetical protein
MRSRIDSSIGRELDAVEGQTQPLGQRPHCQRLGQAGHPLQQDMAAGHQTGHQSVDQQPLTDDDLLQLLVKGRQAVAAFADESIQFGNVDGHG